LRLASPQNPSPAADWHGLGQSDLRWHGEGKLDNRSLRQRSLGIEKYAPATQVLRESGHSSSLEVDGQRQVCSETLGASSFNVLFMTIEI
jgi:hypothetical protein